MKAYEFENAYQLLEDFLNDVSTVTDWRGNDMAIRVVKGKKQGYTHQNPVLDYTRFCTRFMRWMSMENNG